MAKRIRTGVVGLGYFGKFHANHYARHPLSELVAIADPALADAAVAATYNVPRFDDHRALIGRVDAVSIAAPTVLHDRIAADFIEAGIHVLVEKPLTKESAGAGELVAQAARKGVVLNVGHIERFSPAYRALRGAVTEPFLVECIRHAPWRERATDVDVILDLMIHDIDLVLDLVRSAVIEVHASGLALMGRGLDAVVAHLRFANGAAAQISASRVAALPARVVRVHETRHAFAADLTARTAFRFSADGGGTEPLTVAATDALGLEITAFLEAAMGEGPGGVDGVAAVAALEVAERIAAATRL
ncbi:MAG: Gfo/Idh/MocA family oxidoreductase [Bauldia sp.]|nr:Gfo/Idh/MocA family oxidoreductase [Bauldia sp.]